MKTKSNYKWRFFRAGGFDQVKLTSGEDFAHLDSLDQKLWVALASPTSGLDLDPRTAALIDVDKDGRIRVGELLAAVKLACANLKRPDDLLRSLPELPLDSIVDTTVEGTVLIRAARQVLANLGKPTATVIAPADFADQARLFADTKFNGDGVIIRESAEDDATRVLIDEIIASVGSEADRSGKRGINQALIDAFFAEARDHDAWFKEGEADARVFFLGFDKTVAATTAVEAVRAKVEDYYAPLPRCRLRPARTSAAQSQRRRLRGRAERRSIGFGRGAGGVPAGAGRRGAAAAVERRAINPAHAAAIAKFRRRRGRAGARRSRASHRGRMAASGRDVWRPAPPGVPDSAGVRVAALGIARVRAIPLVCWRAAAGGAGSRATRRWSPRSPRSRTSSG